MNRIYILLLAAAPLLLAACSDDDEPVITSELPVTNHNLSGTWSALTWRGQSLPEGASVTVTFVRRDQTFTLEQNTGSMYPQTFTGTYTLRQDKDTDQWVLGGMYDYDGGPWAQEYYVTSLTDTRLVLTATSDSTDVSEYQRHNP